MKNPTEKQIWNHLKDPVTKRCRFCDNEQRYCLCSIGIERYPDNPHEADSDEPNEWQDIISAKENNGIDN